MMLFIILLLVTALVMHFNPADCFTEGIDNPVGKRRAVVIILAA
jgi:hypothetical protein